MTGAPVGGRFFDALGVLPVFGRAPRSEDDATGAPRAIVPSHAAWQARSRGDPGVIGLRLRSCLR